MDVVEFRAVSTADGPNPTGPTATTQGVADAVTMPAGVQAASVTHPNPVRL